MVRYASDTLAYDNNGNLLYDGVQAYTYDAWNRLKTVAHAYRDSSNNLQSGQIFDTVGYDAAGRRITKAVNGTGMMDCTYNDYLNGQSVVEERNGSYQSIEDHVWGLDYVDEALQTRVNANPTGTASWTSYWLCQDANYNVLGIVDSTGILTERYEYSAYGQRQVFYSAGSNDPGCYTPTYASTRVVTSEWRSWRTHGSYNVRRRTKWNCSPRTPNRASACRVVGRQASGTRQTGTTNTGGCRNGLPALPPARSCANTAAQHPSQTSWGHCTNCGICWIL